LQNRSGVLKRNSQAPRCESNTNQGNWRRKKGGKPNQTPSKKRNIKKKSGKAQVKHNQRKAIDEEKKRRKERPNSSDHNFE
jgi:hypothetical protein